MTVKNRLPLTIRSNNLHGIPEAEALNFHGGDAASGRSRTGRRSLQSPTPFHQTEYHQSFRSRGGGPRPRNPGSGWQARNVSNILPSGPELPPQPTRASRRPPPEVWQVRQASSRSQIFPGSTPRPPQNAAVASTDTDVNNNPNARVPPPIVAGGRRRTGRWPWQTRAQTSSIFPSSNDSAPQSTRPQRSNQHKHPWQERAEKSVIFEVLTGQDPVPVRRPRRTYEWDQRQSKLMTAAVQQSSTEDLKIDSEKKRQGQNSSKGSSSSCPWKERSMKSEVFRSPERPICHRPINYAWDQRRSRFSLQQDPTVLFPQGSSYKDTFVEWQTVQNDRGSKPAGKPCYIDDYSKDEKENEEINIGRGGGKRKFKQKSTSGSSEILALPAPPSKSVTAVAKSSSPSTSKLSVNITTHPGKDGNSVKGVSCLEIVPADYHFSNHEMSDGRRK